MNLPPAIGQCPVLFLTGAGASVPLGRFTTKEFLEFFTGNLLRTVPLDDEFRSDLITRLAVTSATRPLDIEEVLGELELDASDSRRFAASPTFVNRVLSGVTVGINKYAHWNEVVRDAIYTAVIQHYSNVSVENAAQLYQPILQQFDQWFGQVPGIGKTIPIFTLNYDTAVEAAARALGVRCVDGLVDVVGATERRWSRGAFEDYNELQGSPSVVLIKIHGSVRWGRRNEDDGPIIAELPLRVGRNPGDFEHVVLYPSLQPKPTHEEPFRTAYRIFRECVGSARVLFVIGCSLRDREIQIAISDGMDDNRNLHVVVIDPIADHAELAQRLELDPKRLAVIRQKFDIPSGPKGYNFLMGGMRGFSQGAVGSPDARIYQFNATYDGWPGSPPHRT